MGEKFQEIALPIHGYVELTQAELAIVDHPTFQRLRRVRQLGFAHFVFPGATHSRFEHSLGAVHVAERIVRSVNQNFDRKPASGGKPDALRMASIPNDAAPFIRLGALLHDLGHLPFGHTLEDELHHLPPHDGRARLDWISDLRYPDFAPPTAVVDRALKPSGGWSLRDLVNTLYAANVASLGLVDVRAFDILCAIICKDNGEGPAKELNAKLAQKLPLQLCRDIVADTICADFLDYLFRDWHHVGKPITDDARLYQYMEAREDQGQLRFVVNVGKAEKVRHDALTSIMDLLGARYRLSETVLFHRTKLAVIALFDRCLLEIAALYQDLGFDHERLRSSLERELFSVADDAMPFFLRDFAEGRFDREVAEALTKRLAAEQSAIAPTAPKLFADTESAAVGGTVTDRLDLIRKLTDRLRDRHIYSLAYKLRMADMRGPFTIENPKVIEVCTLYKDPPNRLAFLSGLETLLQLPAGSVIMYIPPNAKMNAKIARVNLLVDGKIQPFAEYDKTNHMTGLSCGALEPQVNRFYQLWSAQVFVEPSVHDSLTEMQRGQLEQIAKSCLFLDDTGPEIARQSIEPFVNGLRSTRLAARGGTTRLSVVSFPSGIPFDLPQK